MNRILSVDIVSAQESIFSGAVRFVIVPSIDGELGVYPGHAPLLARLAPGEVRIDSIDGDERPILIYVSGGIVEVQPDAVILLSDMALRGEQIDEAAARAVAEHARLRLKAAEADSNPMVGIDYAAARVELAEASAQLRTVSDLKRRRKPKPRTPP